MLDKAPNKRVADFLEIFGKALSAGDVETAVSQFQDDCYWRDLVAFTWNIRTMEGKGQVRAMLEQQLTLTQPSNWAIAKGEEAIEAYARLRPDIMLMDLRMPVMDGLAAIRAIRAEEEAVGRRAPIVVLSANTSPDDRQASAAAGADGHIGKPIRAEELFGAIEAALEP